MYSFEIYAEDAYIKRIHNTGKLNTIKIDLGSPNKEDPTDFHISPSPVSNKTEGMSPGPDSKSLLLQTGTASKQFLSMGTESHIPIPALDPTAQTEIAKGFIGVDILK